MGELAPQWPSTRALRAQPAENGVAHATHAFPRNVVLTGDQLAFDLDALSDETDLLAKVRAAVTEADMSPEEVDGAVRDALEQMGATSAVALMEKSKPCICDHPLLFAAELGEGSCGLCGRTPRR